MASLASRIKALESKVASLKENLTKVGNSYLKLKGGKISGALSVSGRLITGAIHNNSSRTHLIGTDSKKNHVVTVGKGRGASRHAMVFHEPSKTLSISYKRLAVNNITAKKFSVAGTKNFVIDHPLDREGKELVHASLEGPEAGVYYRGTGQLKKGNIVIELPDYFEALTRKGDRTVMLTPICKGDAPISMLASSEVYDGIFEVRCVNDSNPSQKFFWEVKAIRADVPKLVVSRAKRLVENVH